MTPTLILFRCDGTARTGLGHVSRCVALAEALEERGAAGRFLGRYDAGATALLSSACMAFEGIGGDTGGAHDVRTILQAVDKHHPAAVVVDSYEIDDDYVSALGRAGVPILLIDDFKLLERYDCAAVLNFTVNAPWLPYPRGAQRYFLGPEYLLVRKTLRGLRRNGKPRSRSVGRVLIAMGGADAADLSARVARALLKTARNLSVRAVVGRDYGYVPELSSLVADFTGGGEVVVQVRDLAAALTWADICVCGGGLTKYESAYVGLPVAVLSQTRRVSEETGQFARRGLAFDLGLGETQDDATLVGLLAEFIADADRRESIGRAGVACFPEDPTGRAAEALTDLVSGGRS